MSRVELELELWKVKVGKVGFREFEILERPFLSKLF